MTSATNQQTASSINASTIRTRKRIHEAFLELAETTDFSDINVNMLTKAAGLNRTTFYLHYQTLDDLIDEVINEILDELGEGGRLLAAGVGKDQPGAHDSYFRTIRSRPILFQRLLSNPGSSPLSAQLIEMHVNSVQDIWKQYGYDLTANPESWNLRARYAAGGVYSVTVQWLETDMEESVESICERVLELILLIAEAERTLQTDD